MIEEREREKERERERVCVCEVGGEVVELVESKSTWGVG